MRKQSTFLGVAAIILFTGIAAPLQAQNRLDSFKEGQLILDGCIDMVLGKKRGLSFLRSRGYRLKQKKRSWVYSKGAGYASVAGSGIAVGTDPVEIASGCSISMRSIDEAEANALFQRLQNRLLKSGYKPTSGRSGLFRQDYYVKGSDKISYGGSFTPGLRPTAGINFHRVSN